MPWSKYFPSLSKQQKASCKQMMSRATNVSKYLDRDKLTAEGFSDALYKDYLAVKPSRSAYGQGEDRKKAAEFKVKTIQGIDASFKMGPSTRYIDVGSGDGMLAMELIETYGVKDYFLSDVANYLAPAVKDEAGDRFLLLTEPLDMERDVVSSFQVLHHTGAPAEELANFAKMLAKGGFLIISEHDVDTSSWHNLILLEHISFEIAEVPRGWTAAEFKKWFDDYDLRLTSSRFLAKQLTSLGFKLVGKTTPSKKNATYYSLYRKDAAQGAPTQREVLPPLAPLPTPEERAEELATRGASSLAWYQGDAANDFMYSRDRARLLVAAAVQNYRDTESFQAIDTVYSRDTRSGKMNSVAYLRAIRQAVYDNDSVLTKHLAQTIEYDVDTLLDAAEIDYPASLPLDYEGVASSAYVVLITTLNSAARKGDEAVERFADLELLTARTPSEVVANLLMCRQGWFYLPNYDTYIKEILWVIERRMREKGADVKRLFRFMYGIIELFKEDPNREQVRDLLVSLAREMGMKEEVMQEVMKDDEDEDVDDKRTLRDNQVLSEIYSRWRGKLYEKDDVKAMMEEVYAAEITEGVKDNFALVVHQRYVMKW